MRITGFTKNRKKNEQEYVVDGISLSGAKEMNLDKLLNRKVSFRYGDSFFPVSHNIINYGCINGFIQVRIEKKIADDHRKIWGEFPISAFLLINLLEPLSLPKMKKRGEDALLVRIFIVEIRLGELLKAAKDSDNRAIPRLDSARLNIPVSEAALQKETLDLSDLIPFARADEFRIINSNQGDQ
jgi:hypothetical protein